ncbi:unnamed protein product [Rotaria socialis]
MKISLGFFSFWFCFSTTIVIVIFPSKVFDMDYVQIYDERKKSTARLLIAADNILKKDYLNIYFRVYHQMTMEISDLIGIKTLSTNWYILMILDLFRCQHHPAQRNRGIF